MRPQGVSIYSHFSGRFVKISLKKLFILCDELKTRFAEINMQAVHLSGPCCKIRTAHGTNQNSPFHPGPVQPYIKLITIVSFLLICSSRILLTRVSTQGRYYTLYRPFIGLPYFRTCRVICALIVLRRKMLCCVFLTLFQSQEQCFRYILSATSESRVSISEQEDSKFKCTKLQTMQVFV